MISKSESVLDWALKNPPIWSKQLIRELEVDYPYFDANNEQGLGEFVYLTEYSRQAVSPEKIVGQSGHYSGQSWLDALRNPQYKPSKMLECLKLATSNPGYYFANLSDIQLTSFDGENWYSDTSGNHRVIVGKFLLAMVAAKTGGSPQFQQVSTIRRHIDFECLSNFTALQKLIKEAKVDIDLKVKALQRNGSDGSADIRIFVADNRWGKNQTRSEWLAPVAFAKYAQWLTSSLS